MPTAPSQPTDRARPVMDRTHPGSVSLRMILDPTTDPILTLLRARSTSIRRVRYRRNRTVLLSVSRDGRTLNSHECFREAPRRILEAIAVFVTVSRRSAEYRRALAAIQEWEGAVRGLENARRSRGRRRARTNGGDVDELNALYDRFNDAEFGGRLPAIPLRWSRRMTRALGTIAYGEATGGRTVREIAISADLLIPGNEAALRDTLLHEMAHAEAWLRHGHRGHGPIWRSIAERVGCAPAALTRDPVRRRRRRGSRWHMS